MYFADACEWSMGPMYVCFGSLGKGEAIKISSLTFSHNVLSSAGSLCAPRAVSGSTLLISLWLSSNIVVMILSSEAQILWGKIQSKLEFICTSSNVTVGSWSMKQLSIWTGWCTGAVWLSKLWGCFCSWSLVWRQRNSQDSYLESAFFLI